MDPRQHFICFVLRGRISIWVAEEELNLEVDPEGEEMCVLTVQDADEVCEILTELARYLWEKQSGPRREYPRHQLLEEGVVRWEVEGGALMVVPLLSPPAVGLQLDGGDHTVLVPETVSELVQFIAHRIEVHRAT